MREVQLWKFRQNMTPIGGKGLHVQLDETFLRRKYGKGRLTWWERTNWKIFGGICVETKAFFLVVVPNVSKEALWPMILEYIAPESIVHTDGAAVYSLRSTCVSRLERILYFSLWRTKL